eukprot:178569-Prymnesium_polylepis.1
MDMEMPHYSMVLKSWVEMSKPKVIMNDEPYDSKDHMVTPPPSTTSAPRLNPRQSRFILLH